MLRMDTGQAEPVLCSNDAEGLEYSSATGFRGMPHTLHARSIAENSEATRAVALRAMNRTLGYWKLAAALQGLVRWRNTMKANNLRCQWRAIWGSNLIPNCSRSHDSDQTLAT